MMILWNPKRNALPTIGAAGAIGDLPGAAVGAVGLARGGRSAGRVRQVAVPLSARFLCTLHGVDSEDAFVAVTGPTGSRTAEQWPRAILERAPADTRRALRFGWAALGLELGSPDDDDLVLGWEVRRSSPDFALLGAGSQFGLRGEVLVQRQRGSLLAATFVKLENPLARTVWMAAAPGHRQVVRALLEQMIRREVRSSRSSA